jgi:hypothetical protein
MENVFRALPSRLNVPYHSNSFRDEFSAFAKRHLILHQCRVLWGASQSAVAQKKRYKVATSGVSKAQSRMKACNT